MQNNKNFFNLQPFLLIPPLWVCKTSKTDIYMTKTLKVIKPFFVMEEGDTFELTDNNSYISKYEESCEVGNDNNESMSSSYKSEYEIGSDFAKQLIEGGYLAEDTSKEFVNVFDEIAKLHELYVDDLTNLDVEYANQPACLKVEKETVLGNMIKLLDHLYSLKK